MSERVEFMPPKGVVPEDVKAGDSFDLVSTYRIKPDGKICLTQIGDMKMPGYDEDQYKEENKNQNRKGYSDVMGSMQAAMGAQSGPAPASGGY